MESSWDVTLDCCTRSYHQATLRNDFLDMLADMSQQISDKVCWLLQTYLTPDATLSPKAMNTENYISVFIAKVIDV